MVKNEISCPSGGKKFKAYLAPMVRASTTPLRILSLRYGADAVYTEEIIDKSILGCDRVERSVEVFRPSVKGERYDKNAGDGDGGSNNPDGSRKEYRVIDYVKSTAGMSDRQRRKMKTTGEPILLRIVPEIEGDRIVFQIGTGDSILASQAAEKVYRDVSAININMGCPKKFSTAGGMGAALLDDPQRAADIVRSIRSALPSHISVSAKIRLLKDTPSTIDFVRTLVSAGASSITVHARTVGMKEQDEALLERLRPVIDSVKQYGGVEAVVNGDLYNREDMARVVEMSGADSVMVARPALYNTSIFRCKEDGGMLSKQEVIKEYVEECVRWQAHHKNAKYVIAEMMTNRRAPKSLLRSLPHNYPGNQTISKVCACHSISDLCKLWNVQMSMERWTKLLDIKPQTTTEHKYEDAYLLRLEKNDFGSSNRIQAEAILSKRPRIKDKEDEQKCK